VLADELGADDVLFDEDRQPVAIEAITYEWREEPTFNISVEESRTYFVRAGEVSILVHNIDPWDVAYSRPVSPGETFENGPWKGLSVSEAIGEAKVAGGLPEGLQFNAARYTTPAGEEVIATVNNRTLYVA
jgi:hypothetical protein